MFGFGNVMGFGARGTTLSTIILHPAHFELSAFVNIVLIVILIDRSVHGVYGAGSKNTRVRLVIRNIGLLPSHF